MTTSARPWYRLHLSTVLVVALLAAVLIGINVNGRMSTTPVEKDPTDYCTLVKRGWPLTFNQSIYHRKGLYTGSSWFYGSLAKDAALVLVILGAEACVWESLIRLRENRKTK